MSIKLLDSQFDQKLYNEKATHPLQSWEWGTARELTGVQVKRFGEFKNEDLENIYQMTLHPIPKTSFLVGYIPRSGIPSQEFLQFISDFAKKNNIIFVKFEPNVEKSKINSKFENSNFELRISDHPLFPNWTQVLDLTPSEETISKNLKQKTRYNIRLAEKKGVTVKEESTEDGFDKFSKLYFETTKRQKYFGHNQEYHRIVWNTLKDSMAHILIAYYENIPLVAYELFYFNKTLYYTYGGSSDLHRNVMAANLIMWEAIKLGKKLGAEKFDMWGSLPPDYDQKHPWAGFTRFKEGYNTQFVEMIGSYDLVINPFLYQIYNLLYTARNIFLKLKG